MKNEYGNTFDGENQKTTNMVDALNDVFRPSKHLYVYLFIPFMIVFNSHML
jgi:hypothetical protein